MARRAIHTKQSGLRRAGRTRAWWFVLVVLLMGPSTGAWAQLTYYQDQATFENAFPGLPFEGFENSIVPPDTLRDCPGPFNSQTQNLCFFQGGIVEGLSLDAIQQQGDGRMAVWTSAFAGLASDVVGTNAPLLDELEITFPGTEVFAVGMELLNPVTGPFIVNIDIYGPGVDNVLDETEATTGGTQGAFWGVSSDTEPITRIVFRAAFRSGDQPRLMVDNVAFGPRQLIIQTVTPTATPTLDVGESVTYTITVVDPQNNPLPGAQVVIDDEVLGAVVTVGNTDAQGQVTYETVVPENTPDGFYTLTFVAQHNNFDDSEPVARQVEVQRRQLVIQSVTPSTIPTLGIGESATYTVTVIDRGNRPVSGARIEVDDGLLNAVLTVGDTDAQGQVTYETVVPENTPDGFYTLTFVAQHDAFDESDPVMRQVEVVRRTPGLAVTPGTVSFGRVPLGQTDTRLVTISNTGDAPLTIQSAPVVGTHAGDFTRPGLGLPHVVAPGDSLTFLITFQPGARGARSASLDVRSDAGDTSNPLTGQGTAPGISVEPPSVAYGQVDVGTFANRTVTVTNTGNDNLSIEATQITGANAAAFSIVSGGGGRVLGIGEAHAVVVRYTPTDPVAQNATLAIVSDAVDDVGNAVSPTTVALSGEGGVAALEVTPDTVDFGPVRFGTPSTEQTVRVRNTGNVALDLQVGLTGSTRAFAIISGGSGGVLNPGDPPHDIVLQYTPTRTNVQRATLLIQWDGATSAVALQGEGFDVMLPPPEPSGPAERGQAVAIGVAVPVGFAPTAQQLFFRRGGETAYQQVDLVAGADGGLEGAIPPEFVTERGLEYYVRLSDGSTTVTFPEVDPAVDPVRLRVAVPILDAGGVFQPGVYRMVSAPLSLEGATVLLQDDYGPFDPTQWRALRWQPEAEVYVEAGAGLPLESTRLLPGLAVWLITRTGEGFDVEEGRSTDTSEPYVIDLPPGWSQVGAPFAFRVAVSSITNSGLVQGPFFYDGTEYLPNQPTLVPWEGYFVFNPNPTPVTLSVPPVEAIAAPKQAPPEDLFPDADYLLQLRAEIPGHPLRDTQNYVGFAEQATAQPHTYNLAEPPPIGDHLRLSIVADERRYVSAFTPVGEAGAQWDLEVTAVMADERRLAPRTVQVALVEHGRQPAGFERYVVDRDRGHALPVEGGVFHVDLTREHPVRRLSLLVGTPAFAEAHTEGVSLPPVGYVLEQNYPNPFNPETVIRYGLDRQGPVVLELYDMLGRRVRTLVEAEQASGRHEVVWDGLDDAGRPAASGLYVYQLRAGAFMAARRMLLLR